jgi:curved DNA-binding protein CbpA
VQVSKLRFFQPYYAKLGLPPDADDAAIKAAYRRLAKLYHPDRSGDPNTREMFIEVNQAYEVLLKREVYIQEALRRYQNKSVDRRKEEMVREATARATEHADMPFIEFEQSPIYRTAMVVNNLFDYVAVGTGFIMIFAPVFSYFSEMSRVAVKGEEPQFHTMPIFIGFSFLYGVWYFKRKT